ncbi:hypothetical protein [Nannocystis pusilla]|uniref:hypothetical protein n=1 Tax=Nannocystis pusilla TaxID=889268 RepID=UPI003B80AC67
MADRDINLEDRVRELEQRLAAAEQARLAAEAEVAALRVELTDTAERERIAAAHTERLLEGLEVLGEARDALPLFAEVLRVLSDVLEFDAAFIVGFAPEVSPQIVSATDPRLRLIAWPGGAFTDRVLAGRAAALLDLADNPEWQQVEPALREEYASALHVPLHALHSQAMLVCLHRRRGFFTPTGSPARAGSPRSRARPCRPPSTSSTSRSTATTRSSSAGPRAASSPA